MTQFPEFNQGFGQWLAMGWVSNWDGLAMGCILESLQEFLKMPLPLLHPRRRLLNWSGVGLSTGFILKLLRDSNMQPG